MQRCARNALFGFTMAALLSNPTFAAFIPGTYDKASETSIIETSAGTEVRVYHQRAACGEKPLISSGIEREKIVGKAITLSPKHGELYIKDLKVEPYTTTRSRRCGGETPAAVIWYRPDPDFTGMDHFTLWDNETIQVKVGK